MASYTTPGVYIEELPATGPIAPVGTSTLALIGPAQSGPMNVPTKITNWTQFADTFGGFQASPRLYLAHAVRGFFDNQGAVAYIVRVGTAKRALLDLNDRGGVPGTALRVQALLDGTGGDLITVAVTDAQIVPLANNAAVLRARAAVSSATGNTITLQNLADALLFQPGDVITIETTAERATISRIRGNQLVLGTNLTAAYGNTAWVRIADLTAGQTSFRVANPAGLEPGSVIELSQNAEHENQVVNSLINGFVTLPGKGLTNAYTLGQADPPVAITSYEFTLAINQPGSGKPPETWSNLSMDPRHSRYYATVVSSLMVAVTPPPTPSVQPPPNNRPAVIAATNLAGGANDNLETLGLNEYQAGLTALETVTDVNIVCAPKRTDVGVQQALVAHCENMGDRFCILDSLPGTPPFGTPSVISQRATVTSARGYAALYYPWIVINDPTSLTGNDTVLVPPSGSIGGIFARSDAQRGVHKAPANEFITGAVDLERNLSDGDQGQINIEGVDGLRIFPGQRPIVWGARTTAPPDQVPWRYVNVRRLFIFVEQSIKQGIQWAVFEPNDQTLWKKLNRTISEFLTRVWRSGALFGSTAAQAFYVKIDDENNPPSLQELGQLVIEIGIAPVRPAEFVIVRIAMWDGGSQISE